MAVFLLDDASAHGFEFSAEDAAFNFKLVVFPVFVPGDIFFIEINALIDFFEAVVVESVEIEQLRGHLCCFLSFDQEGTLNITIKSHLLHKLNFLLNSFHNLLLELVVIGRFRFNPILPTIHKLNPIHAGLSRLKLWFKN